MTLYSWQPPLDVQTTLNHKVISHLKHNFNPSKGPQEIACQNDPSAIGCACLTDANSVACECENLENNLTGVAASDGSYCANHPCALNSAGMDSTGAYCPDHPCLSSTADTIPGCPNYVPPTSNYSSHIHFFNTFISWSLCHQSFSSWMLNRTWSRLWSCRQWMVTWMRWSRSQLYWHCKR